VCQFSNERSKLKVIGCQKPLEDDAFLAYSAVSEYTQRHRQSDSRIHAGTKLSDISAVACDFSATVCQF